MRGLGQRLSLSRRRFLAAGLLAGLAAITGCSGGIDAPTTQHGEPTWVRFSAPEGSHIQAPASAEFEVPAGKAFTATHQFVSLTFPAGALDRAARVLIDIPDPSVARFSLHIEGATNEFRQPVLLTVDLGGASGALTGASMFWYDEGSGAWVEMGGQLSTESSSITLELSHFSDYGTGGWDGTGGWN